MSSSQKKSEYYFTESLFPSFTVTTKETKFTPVNTLEKILENCNIRAYTHGDEIDIGHPIIHLHKILPDEEDRVVPVLSHEHLHILLGQMEEHEASIQLDTSNQGIFPELTHLGLTERKIRNK